MRPFNSAILRAVIRYKYSVSQTMDNLKISSESFLHSKEKPHSSIYKSSSVHNFLFMTWESVLFFLGVECRLWHNYFSTRGSFRWEHSKTDERFSAGRCKFLVVASSQSLLFLLAVFLSHNRIIVSSRSSFRRALRHFAACCFALFCLGLVLRLASGSFTNL